MTGFVRRKANISLFNLGDLKAPDLKEMLLAKTVSNTTVSVRSFITTPPFSNFDQFKVLSWRLDNEARRCYEEQCVSIYQETVWANTPSHWKNFARLTIKENNETCSIGARYFNCSKDITNDFNLCKRRLHDDLKDLLKLEISVM